MKRFHFRPPVAAGFLCLVAATFPLNAVADTLIEPDHRVALYYARYSPDRMIDILRLNNPRITGQSSLTALAVTRTMARQESGLHWEIEGQIAKHSGAQDHFEFNGLVAVRWTRFPWNHHVKTSTAFGSGFSWASEMPALEPRSGSDEDSSQLLNYLLVELDFSPPTAPQWGLILRLHHRSGVFGLYNGVTGGSNFVGAGIRYAF